MRENFDKALANVLASEGGLSNDKNDHGGLTNFGIIQREYDRWRIARGKPIQSVAKISQDEVQSIYRTEYWAAVHADDLPGGLDYAVFDFAVNAGPGRAAKFLQRAVGVNDDGVIGPATLAAAAKVPPVDALANFSAAKQKFYRGIVANDNTQAVFLKGWLNRVDIVQAAAKKMVA